MPGEQGDGEWDTPRSPSWPSSSPGHPTSEEDRSEGGSDDFHPENWAPSSAMRPYYGPSELGHESEPDSDDLPYVASVHLVHQKAAGRGTPSYACRKCTKHFYTHKQLHRHLRTAHPVYPVHAVTMIKPAPPSDEKNPRALRVVKSNAPTPVDGAATVRNWFQLKMVAKSSRQGNLSTVCQDTRAAVTLIDKQFSKNNFPDARIESLSNAICYSGVGPGGPTTTSTAAYFVLYIPLRTPTGERVLTLWKIKAYVIPSLLLNLLLGMDSLVTQQVILNLKSRILIQPQCENTIADLVVKPKDTETQKTRKITLAKAVTILPHTAMIVPI